MSKINLNAAFRELRKLGYKAEQNFWCCQSCAWHALTDEEAKKVVFYHKQDGVDLKETKSCYLAWAGNGKEIVKVLKKHGIKVEWNGREATRMKIDIS